MNLKREHAHELLEYLDAMQQKGFEVCAWNGLGFDLKWIGHQADDIVLAAHIALKIKFYEWVQEAAGTKT